MLRLPSSLIQRAQETLSAELYRLGHTPKSLEETQRDVLWWTYARAQAALNMRPVSAGWGVAFASAGYAELVPIEVPRAGRDRVTLRTFFSSVSPGTERAQYLRLPNARLGVLGRPGYSAAGIVESVGPRVQGLRPGDLVAATGAAHASLVNLPQRQVFKVPGGVAPEHASLIMLGTICLHGADLAAVRPGERVVAVGAGPIGALAFRMACSSGTPVGIVAGSRRRAQVAASSGAPLLVAGEDGPEIRRLGADVVIEATGDPQGIHTAIEAAGAGARIVLLGSPRGVTRDFPLDRVRAAGLTLIGAHVDTLELRQPKQEMEPRREVGERFLRQLAEGQLSVADLLGPAVDPRRAAVFYRELAEGRHRGGAYFDFSLLAPEQAVHRGHLLRSAEHDRPWHGADAAAEAPPPA